MKRYAIKLIGMTAVLALAACSSEKIEVLKSPCVGAVGSPCGPKRPLNGPLNPNDPNFDPNAATPEQV